MQIFQLLFLFGFLGSSIPFVGSFTTHRRFAYQADILSKKGFWFWAIKHFCSGSLIAEEWILTTASCYRKGFRVNIYLGSDDRGVGNEIEFKKFILHENYNGRSSNNIAVAHIQGVLVTNNVRPIRLIKTDKLLSTLIINKPFLSGWGSSEVLQSFDIQIKGLDDCYIDLRRFNGLRCGYTDRPSKARKIVEDGSPVIFRFINGAAQVGLFYRLHDKRVFFNLLTNYHVNWIENITNISFDCDYYC